MRVEGFLGVRGAALGNRCGVQGYLLLLTARGAGRAGWCIDQRRQPGGFNHLAMCLCLSCLPVCLLPSADPVLEEARRRGFAALGAALHCRASWWPQEQAERGRVECWQHCDGASRDVRLPAPAEERQHPALTGEGWKGGVDWCARR